MIENLAPELETEALILDEDTEDALRFFNGLFVAVALSVPMWVGLVWGVTRVV